MNTLEEFYTNFYQDILIDAESRGLLRHQAFFENVCEDLTNTGDLSKNYTAANYYKTGIEINGYDYDEDRGLLTLLVHQYFQEGEVKVLSKKDVETKFKRLSKFFQKSINGLYRELEETTEAYDAAFQIHQWFKNDEFTTLQLVIISDGKATTSLENLESSVIEGIKTEYKIIDIEYLYKNYLSENNSGHFTVENIKLPALKVHSESDEYQSYLTVLNGSEIVNIYERFGQKLFEQNVRTFLQFRGKVNQGLKNTIRKRPDMFFAFNNGLTATASSVDLDRNGNLVKIENFQIVNGAQTTSSIFSSFKNSNLDVSKISVQMKLTVVESGQDHSGFVSDISEYANTQNKVNKSDFFSNSPFHKEFKAYSKRVRVPAVLGQQKRTFWYYERVRGEFLNEQAYLTSSQKKRFLTEFPKSQLFDKTFLSKSENSWLQKPYVVSKGAQFSSKNFAEEVTSLLEKDNLAITESYYKDAISKIIMFKRIEKMISQATWYGGGFRAQAVTYSMSYFSYFISKSGKHFNFDKIWEKQDLPSIICSVLEEITEAVYFEISNPPANHSNVTQWCKREECWENIKKLDLNFELPSDYQLSNQEKKYVKAKDKKEKRLINGIEIQTFVVSTPIESWQQLYNYYVDIAPKEKFRLTPTQAGVLESMCSGRLGCPSEKQSKILYKLFMTAKDEAFVI